MGQAGGAGGGWRALSWSLAVLVLMVSLLVGCRGGQAREARAAMESGDLVRAEAAWRAVLASAPEDAEALEGLGWTWQLAGQPEEARRSFDQCLALHPDQPGCLRGMAATATAEGNTAAARRWLEAALRAAPADPKVRHSLGLLELATGQPESARGTSVVATSTATSMAPSTAAPSKPG